MIRLSSEIKLLSAFAAAAIILTGTGLYAQTRDYRKTEKIINELMELKDTPVKQQEIPSGQEASSTGETQAPDRDAVLLKTGLDMYSSGNYENAEKIFRKLLDFSPDSAYSDTARIRLANIFMKRGKYEMAMQELSSVSEESGEYPAAMYETACCLSAQENYAGAITCFQTAAYTFPGHQLADDALLQSGILCLKTGKGHDALAAFASISTRYKDTESLDDAFFWIGKVFEQDRELQDIERARDIYRLFLKKSDAGEKYFKDSPLKDRVKKELKRIEENHFRIKQ